MITSSYFAAVGIRLWIKAGTVASAPPTSNATMTEVLSLTDSSVQGTSTTQRVSDYSSPLGFGKALVTESGYSVPINLNLDPDSAGYKEIKRAWKNGAGGRTLQWLRELPVVGTGSTMGQVDAGVGIVTNFQESLANGTVATITCTLEGQGVPDDYQQGSAIATLTLTTAGAGLSAGTGVALVPVTPAAGQLSGRNATASITVNGSGIIQTVTIVAGGTNFKVGDTLTMNDPAVVGVGDTAPLFTVATVV